MQPFENTINSDKNEDNIKEAPSKLDIKKNKEFPLMDQLINNFGYTSIHYKTILFTCLVLFLDGIHMTLLNSTFIPFQKYFDLSQVQVSFISSSMFLAVGCGSLLTLFPSLIIERLQALTRFTFLIFILNLIQGLIPALSVFIITRALIGMSIGILLPLTFNLLCEILPIKNRSLAMISTGIFFGLGAIYVNIFMYWFIPRLEKEGLYSVYLSLSIVPFIIAVVFYLYLQESPRSLILHNKINEAFIILEKMINKKLSPKEKEIIVTQVKSGANKHNDKDVKLSSIFKGKYKRITIILILIWMFNSYLTYGGTITFSLVEKYIEDNNNASKLADTDNTDSYDVNNGSSIIIDQILVYLVSSPGSLIAGLMTEIKIFGRKMTTLIGFMFIGIFSTFCVINVNNFSIYFAFSAFFISFSFNASTSYSSEVYPTNLRNKAVGFLNFCTRVAGFVSQFVAVELFEMHYLAQIYFSIAVCFIACLITYSLPYDTHGRALDTDDTIQDVRELENYVEKDTENLK